MTLELASPGRDDAAMPPAAAPVPLTAAQRRVWLAEQMAGGAVSANTLSLGLHLRGDPDRAALALALRIVVARHEALRSTFALEGGQPVQRVHADGPPVLAVTDLSGAPEPARAAYEAARRAAFAPFDVQRGPPLRALLLRLGPAEHVLVCALHHIVADGWALRLFAQELEACYAALAARRQPDLPPAPALRQADLAAWEAAWLGSEAFDRLRAAALRRLEGAPPPPTLPPDPGLPDTGAAGASRAVRLPPDLAAAARGAARRMGATPFALSLAAFAALLRRVTGREDLLVGIPAARRGQVEFEPVIGLFADLVVARIDLSGDPTFAEAVRRTQEALLAAMAEEDVPFERLVAALPPAARGTGANPVFQILFGAVPPGGMTRFGDLPASPYPMEAAAAPFELGIGLIAEAGETGATWVRAEFRTATFDPARVQDLLERYARLLAEACARPEARLSALGEEAGPAGAPPAPPPRARAASVAPPPAEPADKALEEVLVRAWEAVLRRRPPGRDTNFFDLGGHSLQAVALAHEVGKALGRPVAIAALLRDPTVAGMARNLRGGGEGARLAIPLTPPASGAARPPLFLGGSTPTFRQLGRGLGPGQPLYQLDVFAMQEQRLLAGRPLIATVPEIASAYLEEILQIQPEGPYLIGGQCDGGIVALEIALQLQAGGRRVALLAQFDTPVDGFYRPRDRAHWVAYRTRRAAARVGAGLVWDWFRRRLRPTAEELRVLHSEAVTWGAVRAYRQAARFGGEVMLFRSADRAWWAEDVARGWERRAERVRVHDVPGDHLGCLALPPTQERVAEAIARALGETDR